MNSKETDLAVAMLLMASDEFSNHSCNDVDEKLFKKWSKEERIKFVKEYWDWVGEPENYDEDYLELGDSMLMEFLAYKLKNTYSE